MRPRVSFKDWLRNRVDGSEPTLFVPSGEGSALLRPLLWFAQMVETRIGFLKLPANDESAEADLQQHEQTRKLGSALAQTADSILITNRDGLIEYVNPAFERLTGYEAEEVYGKTPRILKSGKHNPRFYKKLWRTIRAGKPFRAVFLNRAKDGELFYEDRTITPLTDVRGRVTHFVSAGRNVTDRKTAQEIQTRLTGILEATPDLVVTIDREGFIHYMNRAGRRLLELPPTADLSRMKMADIRPEWCDENFVATAIPAAIRDGSWSGESAFRCSRGGEIAVSEVLIAHKTQGGEVRFLSSVARDISDRKQFETQLVYMADHDPLTALYSRRRFHEELSRHLEEARRYDTRGAVLFMDLDDFKGVNDTFGHSAGDELLVSLSSLFKKQLRGSDVVARLGGDEFAFLLPRACRREAQTLAHRLIRAVEEHVISPGGRPCRVTASIGVALLPDDGSDTGGILAHADLAMYRAKEGGGNRVELYADCQSWQDIVQSKLSGEQRILHALERDELTLHAQPILDIRANRIRQYELLLRMEHDSADSAPRDLLHTAERFALTHVIDRWVTRQAIEILRQRKSRDSELRLSVNLARSTLSDEELLSIVRGDLIDARVPAETLTFEITESASIADTERARAFMVNLGSIGCRFALDNFGVGFSSLTQLKHLPLKYVKIDGSFVRKLPESPVDQHLVRAIVGVARGLKMQTVAEFVEDAETLDLCRELGVDFAQGYFVGRPRPASELV